MNALSGGRKQPKTNENASTSLQNFAASARSPLQNVLPSTSNSLDPFMEFFRDLVPNQVGQSAIFEDEEIQDFAVYGDLASGNPGNPMDIPPPPPPLPPIVSLTHLLSEPQARVSQTDQNAFFPPPDMSQLRGTDEPDNDPWLSARNPPNQNQ